MSYFHYLGIRMVRTGKDCVFKSAVSLSRNATLSGERNLPPKSETLRDGEVDRTGLFTGSM